MQLCSLDAAIVDIPRESARVSAARRAYVVTVGQISYGLLHPGTVRVLFDARDLDPARVSTQQESHH
jgi:hypothetical protein